MSTRQELLYAELTGDVIAAAFEVHNSLGCGLIEKVYENALTHELVLSGHEVSAQREFTVHYKDRDVGTYYADLVVDGKVIVEVKAEE